MKGGALGLKKNLKLFCMHVCVCPVMERQKLGLGQLDCGISLMGNALAA